MITLSTLFTFAGFWVCYQTSQRAHFRDPNRLELWLRIHRKSGNRIGVCSLTTGLVLSMVNNGVLSGMFSYVMILITVASLIIMLNPLGYLKLRNIATVALVAFIFELAI